MARIKKPDMPPPPPKQPRECKHGCTDCIHYRLDAKAFPCRDCERWNYWEDAHPEKNNTVPFPPPVSVYNASAQDSIEPVSEPKKRGRRTQLAAPQADTPEIVPEQVPVPPKKRGRKPKIDAVVPSQPEGASVQSIAEPITRMRKSTPTADDAPDLLPPEKEQLSLF